MSKTEQAGESTLVLMREYVVDGRVIAQVYRDGDEVFSIYHEEGI